MSNIVVKEVSFNGAKLMAAQTKDDSKVYVGIKWVCEGLGLSEGQAKSERLRIQEDVVLSKGGRKIALPTKGGKQETICLELTYLPLWLAKINANIIDDPEIQSRLINYQLHAAEVLAAAFLGQSRQESQRPNSRVKPAIKDALETAKLLESIGVKPGIAQAACLRAVEKNCNLDLQEIAKCLPFAQHETGYLNPTQIGKRLGLSAAKTNQLLMEKGLQVKQDNEWRITDAGKQYGEELPYVRNGHSGYQIQWSKLILPVLTEEAEYADSY